MLTGMQIIVLGAGLTGLSTALLLARDGHAVTVLERDPADPGPPEAAWSAWDRPGVNQFRLPHFLLPRWHQEMARELPDVLDALRAAGACDANMLALLPEALRGPLRPGDDRFTAVTARRPVLEAVLARAAAATAGVTVCRGTSVTGLLATGTPTAAHQISGVLTAGGGTLRADLVVDCGGRRSALPSWLEAVGAPPPHQEREDCGFVYYGLHLRGTMPALRAPILQNYDSLTLLTLPGDGGTWSVVLATSSRDKALRPLREQPVFDAVLAQYPLAAHWRDGVPISGVEVMAGIEDRLRRLSVDGVPVATGVVAIGDAWGATNPSVGRGASIGLLHACLLRDVLRTTTDPVELASVFADRTAGEIEPIYRGTLWYDRNRLAEVDADAAGVAYAPADPRWAAVKALAAAALADQDLIRSHLSMGWLLTPPDEVFGAAGVLDRTMALGAGAPQYPLGGPDRSALLKTIGESA
jgi:2-polyprenyl-6-methoxyphenol hydroxylase-like FAD-dependent oxidoreductase